MERSNIHHNPVKRAYVDEAKHCLLEIMRVSMGWVRWRSFVTEALACIPTEDGWEQDKRAEASLARTKPNTIKALLNSQINTS